MKNNHQVNIYKTRRINILSSESKRTIFFRIKTTQQLIS